MSFLQRKHLRRSETRPGRRFGVGKRVTLRCEQFEERTLLSGHADGVTDLSCFMAAGHRTSRWLGGDRRGPLTGPDPLQRLRDPLRHHSRADADRLRHELDHRSARSSATEPARRSPSSMLTTIRTSPPTSAPSTPISDSPIRRASSRSEQTGSTTGLPADRPRRNDWGIEISLDVEWAHVDGAQGEHPARRGEFRQRHRSR